MFKLSKGTCFSETAALVAMCRLKVYMFIANVKKSKGNSGQEEIKKLHFKIFNKKEYRLEKI